MINLKQLLFEDGSIPGRLELISTSPIQARDYAENEFEKAGTTLDDEIPNFDKNFKDVQKMAKKGHTQRKDMPVIEKDNILDLQRRLSKGYIDVTSPYSKETDNSNPFPTGLSGEKAKHWLKNGLHQYDGAKTDKDDVVSVKKKSVPVKKLKPIQRQIYYDKSMSVIAKLSVSASVSFMKTQMFIVSSDNYIIDGHHRFQSMMLIDPSMSANVLSIDLPLNKLLPMSLSYSDAVGNKRNQ